MIEVRIVDDVGEMGGLCDLIDDVWSARLVIPEMVRAISHAGGYVAGAYDGGALVGASVGFLGQHHGAGVHLHSHITGVAPAVQGHGVGFLVKQHQRTWCLERGIATIEWTYDPSIARNAWFNLQRLGADVVTFAPDFYGAADGDRFVVRWSLAGAGAREEPVPGESDVCVPIGPGLRAGLLDSLGAGLDVVGVTRSGTYVLRRR